MQSKSLLRSVIALCALGSLALPATAHYPWIAPAEHYPRTHLDLQFGWGHHFGDQRALATERVAKVSVWTPQGIETALTATSDGNWQMPLSTQQGLFLVTANQVRSYYSRTPRGGVAQSRRETKDAVSCSFSGNTMKAVVRYGNGGGGFDRVVGHTLELVPLTDPSLLKAGETLPIRVLYQERPYAGALIASRQGAAQEPVAELTTNADGVAELPLDAPGRWLVRSHAQQDYGDSSVCDTRSYTATLTFEVRGTD